MTAVWIVGLRVLGTITVILFAWPVSGQDRPAGRHLGAFAVTANPIEVLDGNPLFTGKSVSDLSEREVGALDLYATGRVGTTADGVSALLLRVPISGDVQIACDVAGGERNGSCAPLVLRPSPPSGGKRIAVALFQPPSTFGPGAGDSPPKYFNEVESRDVIVRLTLRSGNRTQSAVKRLVLARPPLILVHGTFDSADLWTNATGGRSFVATIEAAGFKTFAVDYSGSFLSQAATNQSSFVTNRDTVWAGPEGISDALKHFRSNLRLAAARVDVIGHSLGGLLARVHASSYFAASTRPYKRPENFEKGDISRLITLCTPHHGSVLSALLDTFHRASVAKSGVSATALASITIGLKKWWEGIQTDGGAVRDQLPGSTALKHIGATPIPAFAIGCTASDDFADDVAVDPAGEYRKRVDDLSWLFYNAPALLQDYLKSAGMEREAEQIPWILDAVFRHWLRRANETRSWIGLPLNLDVEDSPAKVAALQSIFRAFLFRYDENDYTVGVTSQRGSLPAGSYRDIAGILHGPAPRYWTVQKRIIDLLKEQASGGDRFAEGGFPEAGADLAPSTPSKALIAKLAALAGGGEPPPGDPRTQAIALANQLHSDAYIWGDEAIRWSGMVYAHAGKFMKVAEDTKTIFMFRPVNPDSTLLIAGNASTKPMPIKAKSSDWGPHKGLLPVDQAFSKKAESPAETIARFNCDAFDSLRKKAGETDDAIKVRAVPLVKSIDGREYEVLRTTQSSGELDSYGCVENEKKKYVPAKDGSYAEQLKKQLKVGTRQPLLLRGTGAGGVIEYLAAEGAPPPVKMPPEQVLPFLVFADKDGKYMTADYDMLAIGSQDKECTPVGMHDKYGAICDWQIPLVERLNQWASDGECKYGGGDLVHHGPEAQYPGSEFIDYPIIAFIPARKSEPSRIVAIRQGPDGYRDMHLKRLFFRLRQQEWKIDPNPKAVGWRWGNPDPLSGYELSDQTTFPADVPTEMEPRGPLLRPCELSPNWVAAQR